MHEINLGGLLLLVLFFWALGYFVIKRSIRQAIIDSGLTGKTVSPTQEIQGLYLNNAALIGQLLKDPSADKSAISALKQRSDETYFGGLGSDQKAQALREISEQLQAAR